MFHIEGPSELIAHITDATFRVENPHISQCIDGRRTLHESNYGISIPGGGIGQLASMLSVIEETHLGDEPGFREQVLEILIGVIGGEQNFSFHTDDHCCGSDDKIGCGHIQLLLNEEYRRRYLLSDESRDFIMKVIQDLRPHARVNVLHGEHHESGVLVIDSLFYSVHAAYAGHQLFVYTPELAHLRNSEIAKRMYQVFIHGTGMSLTPESIESMLNRKMDLHFRYTLESLAPHLPVYSMKHFLNGGIKHVHALGVIGEMYHLD